MVVRKFDFIGRSVKNDCSAVAEGTGIVARILSSILLQEKYPVGKVYKLFSKSHHQNDFDKIFATAGTEL